MVTSKTAQQDLARELHMQRQSVRAAIERVQYLESQHAQRAPSNKRGWSPSSLSAAAVASGSGDAGPSSSAAGVDGEEHSSSSSDSGMSSESSDED